MRIDLAEKSLLKLWKMIIENELVHDTDTNNNIMIDGKKKKIIMTNKKKKKLLRKELIKKKSDFKVMIKAIEFFSSWG